MTLDLLFITISVDKRDRSVEEAAHQEMVKKLLRKKKHVVCVIPTSISNLLHLFNISPVHFSNNNFHWFHRFINLSNKPIINLFYLFLKPYSWKDMGDVSNGGKCGWNRPRGF